MTDRTADPIERSYQVHREAERRRRYSGVLPELITDPASIDFWRHERMKDLVDPLLATHPESTWMTVGDGRFGSDARSLIRKGHAAMATSLTDHTLVVASEQGWIDSFSAENAESLSFDDNAFDFILCKESFHHFPRPPLALYEMLRVARLGVVLIEPLESGRNRPLDWAKQKMKRVLRGDATSLYEPEGNFLYRTDPRSLQKMLAAMGLRHLAVHHFNDFYMARFKAAPARSRDPAFWATRAGIGAQNTMCRLRLMNWGLGSVVLFSVAPEQAVLDALEAAGYDVIETPENPYLDSPTETSAA